MNYLKMCDILNPKTELCLKLNENVLLDTRYFCLIYVYPKVQMFIDLPSKIINDF